MNLGNLPTPCFPDRESYLSYCSALADKFRRDIQTPTFDLHRKAIASGGDMVIPTSWGGVHIVSYQHPEVEKFLVIDQGRFLAFEKHAEKVEALFGEEGLGVLVYRCEQNQQLKTETIEPGWTRTLRPGQEHTIIALSNLLVRERSTDPRGMDQDLIFIYTPQSTESLATRLDQYRQQVPFEAYVLASPSVAFFVELASRFQYSATVQTQALAALARVLE